MRQDSHRHSMEKEADPERLKNYFKVKQLVSGRAEIGVWCACCQCQLSLLCDLRQERGDTIRGLGCRAQGREWDLTLLTCTGPWVWVPFPPQSSLRDTAGVAGEEQVLEPLPSQGHLF